MGKKVNKKMIAIVVAVVVFLVIVGIFVARRVSLENKLINKTWWEEVTIKNEPYNEKYYVEMWCKRYTFCPAGNIRKEELSFGGGKYLCEEKVTSDTIPEHFYFSHVDSSNDDVWKVYITRELQYGEETYKWSKKEAKNTWYLDGDKLRIGENHYSLTEAKVKINPLGNTEVTYWCAECGEAGPYEKECPNCKGTDKIEVDWKEEQE